MRGRLLRTVFVSLSLALLAGGAAAAQDSVPPAARAAPATAPRDSALERRASQLASQLRCPVCLNLSIEDSPTQLAQEMKQVIRERLARGDSPDEVRRYFIQRYGEWVLLKPEPKGLNLSLWLLPLAGLLLGGAAIALAVRRWVRRPAPAVVEE